jgi:hypothetical protein
VFKNWFFKKFFKKQFAITRFISTYTNIPVNPVPGVRLGGYPRARPELAIRQLIFAVPS